MCEGEGVAGLLPRLFHVSCFMSAGASAECGDLELVSMLRSSEKR